jgi:predicted RNA binding protein YcfA (HicA-like mRNA interferase family)
LGKYPTFNCRQLEHRLREIGCQQLRNTGSHRHYFNPFRLIASSPFHGIPATCGHH